MSSTTLHLRSYQEEAIQAVFAAWNDGMQRPAVVLPTGAGKAQPVDEPVLTPTGWRKIGELSVGDLVIGSTGAPVRVTGVFPQGIRPTAVVRFTDNTEVRCDLDHLWSVQTRLMKHDAARRGSRAWKTLTAEQIQESKQEWCVPVPGVVEYAPSGPLPIDPYTLGVLLGDGGLSVPGSVKVHTRHDVVPLLSLPEEHRVTLSQDKGVMGTYHTGSRIGRSPNLVMNALRDMGLHGHTAHGKFIPERYLRASAPDRLALLRGILDTDGSASGNGVDYVSVSEALVDGVAELVRSLGGRCKVSRKSTSWTHRGVKKRSMAYRAYITMPRGVNPFRVERKANALVGGQQFDPVKKIQTVENGPDLECVCISVDAPDHLYVTSGFAVTHNTVIFSHLSSKFFKDDGRRVVILVHRDELADQAIGKIRTVCPKLSVGKVKAADNEVNAQVVVASVQTLARPNRLRQLQESEGTAGRVGLVIVDECFPAGTLVGDTPIEKLKVGDLVPTWNENTGQEELRPVRAVMSRTPSSLVQVTADDGQSFVCTPNHPILTSQGWCPAGGLWRGASVVSFTHDANANRSTVHPMRNPGNGADEITHRPVPENGADVLFGRLSGHMGGPGPFGTDVPDEPSACFGTDASEQSDAPAGEPGEDVCHTPEHRAPAPGWQRYASAGTTAQARGSSGLAHGGGDCSGRPGTAAPLQGGYCTSVHEGTGGGGRGIPFLAGPPILRPAPGRTAVFSRVARVQVLEPGRDGTYGGVCPDRAVYNIEVDTTHTYLIGNGLVVHNCHHAAAESYKTVMRGLGCYSPDSGTRALGVTATLARGDGQGLGDVWQDVVYSKSVLWMISKGYLVDVRGQAIESSLDLSQVKRSGGDYQAKDLGEALLATGGPDLIAKAMQQYAPGRRSIVFTPDVASAWATKESLDAALIRSEVITGATPREERLKIYEAFRKGSVQALVNCMVLTEGADFPFADCAVIARPTQSAPLYIQMVGRVLRTYGQGKKDALVLDLTGTGGRISTLIDLAPGEVRSMRPQESLAEAYVRTEEEANRRIPAKSMAFSLKNREMDMFAGSEHAWLRTHAGVLFLGGVGETGKDLILIWPSQTPGLWDVVVAPDKGKWRREKTGLELGMAQAWGETIADDLMTFNTTRSAGWRKTKASPQQLAFARSLRIEAVDDARKGPLSDLISVHMVSRKVDRYVKADAG